MHSTERRDTLLRNIPSSRNKKFRGRSSNRNHRKAESMNASVESMPSTLQDEEPSPNVVEVRESNNVSVPTPEAEISNLSQNCESSEFVSTQSMPQKNDDIEEESNVATDVCDLNGASEAKTQSRSALFGFLMAMTLIAFVIVIVTQFVLLNGLQAYPLPNFFPASVKDFLHAFINKKVLLSRKMRAVVVKELNTVKDVVKHFCPSLAPLLDKIEAFQHYEAVVLATGATFLLSVAFWIISGTLENIQFRRNIHSQAGISYCVNQMSLDEYNNKSYTRQEVTKLMNCPDFKEMMKKREGMGAEAWIWQLRKDEADRQND